MALKPHNTKLPVILTKATRIDRSAVMIARCAPIDALQSHRVDRQPPAGPASRLFSFKRDDKKV
ncbi:MAG: hypothetical protein IJU72_00215 [Bacteroidales bacterium]|nr:hypothetical protein [Bacteroidales bacterium]